MGISYGRPTIARGGKGIKYTENGNIYGMHIFYSSDFFVLLEDRTCDYLIVAGGGSGCRGNNGPAGGGAGGLILTSSNITKGAYSVVIGAGGIGTANYLSYNGNDSSCFDLTAIGGGGAGRSGYPGKDGGSGGGNSYYLNVSSSYGGVALQPSSNPGIGYGAPITRRTSSMPRGGGTGGEQPGANYFDGLTVWGNVYGIGGFNYNTNGPGRANTGDGGGGVSGLVAAPNNVATNGGSGIVIIRYQI